MIIPCTPFETVRAQTELFASQCGQWETIWNSQLIGRYKEMSVWHQVNLMIYPSQEISQRTEWSLHCSMLSLTLKARYTPPGSLEQQISVITTSTTMHIYIYRRQIVVKMAISHFYWHLLVNNGKFIFLLTSSSQQCQFYISTDI